MSRLSHPRRLTADKWWSSDKRKFNKGGDRTGTKNSRVGRDKTTVVSGREIPDGTKEEMSLAYNHARQYQAVLLDFSDKEEIPDDVLAYQRRIFHFARHGPRKGYFHLYPRVKLVQADVLYILTAKVPARIISEKFNIDVRLVRDIRSGMKKEWLDEYLLVRRIRKALVCKYKKNWTKTHITTLTFVETNQVIAFFSSKRKAVDYRRTYASYTLKLKNVSSLEKTGELDSILSIEEQTVTE